MNDRWDRLAKGCRQSAPDGGEVTVEESADEGRARVRFTAPAGWRLERLAITHRHPFDWLSNRKAADGIVLARRPDGIWEAHIVECKGTMGDGNWRKVREQHQGSRIRLDALCGVLGITVERIVLYTAFRDDKMGVASPEPLLTKLLVGATGTLAHSHPDVVAARVAWHTGEVTLQGFPPLPHRRVALTVRDDTGYATVSLSP
ncbi:MAG: hypothetical protein H6705_13310 [Myxococcales bacterium]|nr:hypothetical protein [Myxococcales bacterium]